MAHYGGHYRDRIDLLKVMCLKMTSERRVCLRLTNVKSKEFHILGAEIRKARAPSEMCRGTESKMTVCDWQMNAWTLQTCDSVRDR